MLYWNNTEIKIEKALESRTETNVVLKYYYFCRAIFYTLRSNRNKCCIEIKQKGKKMATLTASNRNKCCIEIHLVLVNYYLYYGSNRNKCCIEIFYFFFFSRFFFCVEPKQMLYWNSKLKKIILFFM